MHISDGMISGEICIAAGIAAAGLTGFAIKKMTNEDIPRTALMTAAFFIISLIHFRLVVTSIHLNLIAVVGIILGVYSFPAILIALLFQTLMLQHGGITTLGVNTIIMGLPAFLVGIFYKKIVSYTRSTTVKTVLAFFMGSLSIALAATLAALFLVTGGKEFNTVAELLIKANVPLALIEGIAAAIIIRFLYIVKPEMLQ